MTITNYLWDGDSYLEVYNQVGTTTAAYTNEPTAFGNVISQLRNSTTSFYHYNVQGSTHQLTDLNENVTDTFSYDAWGNEPVRTGTTTTPFQYLGESGYYYDEKTNYNYVRARVYQPSTGRWSSPDPLVFVDGLNLFLYTHNNPVYSIDPSGSLTITAKTKISDKLKCPAPYAEASWEFSIDKWPCRGNEGYFYQQVAVSCWSCKCPKKGKCPTKRFSYWERWPVSVPYNVKKNQKIKITRTDKAFYQSPSHSQGLYEQSGIVRFYCVTPPGNQRMKGELYPADTFRQGSGVVPKSRGDCETSSGFLQRHLSPPKTWGEDPADYNIDGRVFQLDWDCCCDNQSASMYTFPEIKTVHHSG